jgi:hypothetical protein
MPNTTSTPLTRAELARWLRSEVEGQTYLAADFAINQGGEAAKLCVIRADRLNAAAALLEGMAPSFDDRMRAISERVAAAAQAHSHSRVDFIHPEWLTIVRDRVAGGALHHQVVELAPHECIALFAMVDTATANMLGLLTPAGLESSLQREVLRSLGYGYEVTVSTALRWLRHDRDELRAADEVLDELDVPDSWEDERDPERPRGGHLTLSQRIRMLQERYEREFASLRAENEAPAPA